MLENKLKELEVNLNTEDNIQLYKIHKKELDAIYDHIAEGIKFYQNMIGINTVTSRQCFFLNFKKKRGSQNQIRTLTFDEKEIDEDVEILNKIYSFYETHFKSQSSKNVLKIFDALLLLNLLTTIK